MEGREKTPTGYYYFLKKSWPHSKEIVWFVHILLQIPHLSPVKECVPLTHTVHLTFIPSSNSPIPLWVSVWKSFYPSTASFFSLFNTRLHTIIKPWGLRDPGQKCKRNATCRPLSSLTPTSHRGGFSFVTHGFVGKYAFKKTTTLEGLELTPSNRPLCLIRGALLSRKAVKARLLD